MGLLGLFIYWPNLLALLGEPSAADTPEYEGPYEKDYNDCPYIDFGASEGNIPCYYAITDARNPELLALVTYDAAAHSYFGTKADLEVSFYHSEESYNDGASSFAKGLFFPSKYDADVYADAEGIDLSEAIHYHGVYVFESGVYVFESSSTGL
jgi:hypothetical protein